MDTVCPWAASEGIKDDLGRSHYIICCAEVGMSGLTIGFKVALMELPTGTLDYLYASTVASQAMNDESRGHLISDCLTMLPGQYASA